MDFLGLCAKCLTDVALVPLQNRSELYDPSSRHSPPEYDLSGSYMKIILFHININ